MFSRSSLYAIRAMAVLAGLPAQRSAGAGPIAAASDVPASYLSKLFQILARAGLVSSQKGPGGGFRLARPASRITLWQILEPIEELSQKLECILGQPKCSEENPCALHEHWKGIRSRYEQMLRRTTLAEIAQHATAKRDLQELFTGELKHSYPT